MIRLNGWVRLWIAATVLWTAFVLVYNSKTFPSEAYYQGQGLLMKRSLTDSDPMALSIDKLIAMEIRGRSGPQWAWAWMCAFASLFPAGCVAFLMLVVAWVRRGFRRQ